MKKPRLPILLASALLATLGGHLLRADDFTTLDGDKYTNATVKRVEPDGIVVADSDGVRKLKFKNLPPALGAKYGYNPANAASYQATVQQRAILQQNAAAALDQARKVGAIVQQNAAASTPSAVSGPQINFLEDEVLKAQQKLNSDTAQLDALNASPMRDRSGHPLQMARDAQIMQTQTTIENDKLALTRAQERLNQARQQTAAIPQTVPSGVTSLPTNFLEDEVLKAQQKLNSDSARMDALNSSPAPNIKIRTYRDAEITQTQTAIENDKLALAQAQARLNQARR